MKKIIAHRGAPNLAHENTIESFLIAVDSGTDFIEFDVRRTKDNILIAHHDPFIIHDCRKSNISELSFSQLQIISSENGYQIPIVEQILSSLYTQTGFDIELKEEGCEEEVLEMLRALAIKPKYFFTSFNPLILSKLKDIDPSIQTGFLFDEINSVKLIDNKMADYLCPNYYTYLQNRDYFLSPDTICYTVAVWTLNDSDELKKAIADPRIEAVITNDTALAVKIRECQLK